MYRRGSGFGYFKDVQGHRDGFASDVEPILSGMQASIESFEARVIQ